MIRERWRHLLMLGAVIAVGAYFRLWNIQHTFNIIHDFDEGAYAIGARALLDGSLPYRDFVLIHPPLYNIVLAGSYRLFGYDFLIGRFLSIVFSVGCVAVLYLLGTRLYDLRAGIVAAGFFACSGLPVYLGRRGVQDSLGLLLALAGLLLAVQYIDSKRTRWLVLSGFLFGLAVATKYLFLPLVLGSVIAMLVCSDAADSWKTARHLASPRFWIRYVAVSVSLYAVLLLLRRLAVLPVPIPVLEPLDFSVMTAIVVILVFVVPVSCALLLMGVHPRRDWLMRSMPLWMGGRRTAFIVFGAAAGFCAAVVPFFVWAPAEYVRQTFLLHQQRNIAEFPSFVGLLRVIPVSDVSLLLTSVPLLCAIPVIVLLLRRNTLTRSNAFVALTLAVAFLFCQAFPPMPRYYTCVYPLVFLGLSGIVVTVSRARERLTRYLICVAVCALFLASLVSAVDALIRYSPEASMRGGRMYTVDENVYIQAAAFLRSARAEKVYAVNPAFAALADGVNSSIRADSLAELFLEKRPAEDVLAQLSVEGVDFVVLDPWLTYWGDTWPEARLFAGAVRRNARLEQIIPYGSRDHVEVYRLDAEPEALFNSDFVLWDRYAGLDYPAGWQPLLLDGGWDLADLNMGYWQGRPGVALSVFEDGRPDDDDSGTHAGITQLVPFPTGELRVDVVCPEVTGAVGVGARGPAIHFLDGDGHSVVVAFSDAVTQSRLSPSDDVNQVIVVQPCHPGEWQSYSLDLRELWIETGWSEPEQLRILFVVSANSGHAAYYEFLVGGVHIS